MKNDEERKFAFLNLPVLPGRLTAVQAGWYLGFKPHEVPILVGAGLLAPLGHPPVNQRKFFAIQTLSTLRDNEKWFAKATDAISAHWRRKNARRRSRRDDVSKR